MKAIRIILAIIILGLVASLIWAFRTNEIRSSAGPRALYSSQVYKVEFEYPADWQPDLSSSTTERFAGESGYFELSAAGANGNLSLADIVGSEAGHALKPYGSAPSVETLKVGGEDARLILPSADADPALKGQAALVVTYPDPLLIGSTYYEYLVIRSDEYHIRGFADTLKFTQ